VFCDSASPKPLQLVGFPGLLRRSRPTPRHLAGFQQEPVEELELEPSREALSQNNNWAYSICNTVNIFDVTLGANEQHLLLINNGNAWISSKSR
jgi:hypothetical protein